jgi:hypothetical protein
MPIGNKINKKIHRKESRGFWLRKIAKEINIDVYAITRHPGYLIISTRSNIPISTYEQN